MKQDMIPSTQKSDNRRLKTAIFGLLALLILTLLPACASAEVRTGFRGTNVPGYIRYRYATFTGTESDRVRLEAGERLPLEYRATVQSGQITFEVLDPDGEIVWETTLQETDSGSVDLVAEESGTYVIQVEGQETSGDFKVTWETQEEASRGRLPAAVAGDLPA